jgi:hypothetical protein
MITLEDRLHDTGDDLRRAATQVPARGLTHPRPIRRAAGWLGAAAAIGVLIALPLWLSGGGTAPEGPPVGGESASTSSEVQPSLAPFGLDEAHIIIELAPGLSPEHAEGLMAELRQHPEVNDLLLVTRDQAVSEWLEIHAATFGGDEASLQAAMAEVPASIRLLVHEEADRRAFGESLAEELLRREGQPEPHPVIRVIVNIGNNGDPGGTEASSEPKPRQALELGPISDAEFADLVGAPAPNPEMLEDSARLVAVFEQAGFGVLSLYTYETDIEHRGDVWYCVGAVGDPAFGQTFDGKALVLGVGETCSREAEILQFGLLSGSACVPRVESLFALYGLDETVSRVDIALTDGSTARLTPINGAILFAWDGPPGMASMTLNDDADPEMASRVQAELSVYGLAEDRCRENAR